MEFKVGIDLKKSGVSKGMGMQVKKCLGNLVFIMKVKSRQVFINFHILLPNNKVTKISKIGHIDNAQTGSNQDFEI